MKRIIIAVCSALLLTILPVTVALAAPPAPACNGLDRAHAKVHGSGTQAEQVLDALREANGCHDAP